MPPQSRNPQVSKKKSPELLNYEAKKAQLSKTILTLKSLDASRLTLPSSDPGNLDAICAACHTLDPTPLSPLLAALIALAKTTEQSDKIVSRAQHLYTHLRPISSLDYADTDPLAITYAQSATTRVLPTSTANHLPSPFTALETPGIVITGLCGPLTGLRMLNPALFGASTATGAENNEVQDTEVDVELHRNDLLYIPEPPPPTKGTKLDKSTNKNAVPPPNYKVWKVVTLNKRDGGVMATPYVKPTAGKKLAANSTTTAPAPTTTAPPAASSSPTFMSLVSLLNVYVVTVSTVTLHDGTAVTKSRTFKIPPPDAKRAYNTLRDLASR